MAKYSENNVEQDRFSLIFLYIPVRVTQNDALGHGDAMGEKLMQHYEGKGLTNHIVGRLRKNKKRNPKHVINKRRKEGEFVWKRKGIVVKWHDKRDAFVIQTSHKFDMQETQNRKGKNLSSQIPLLTTTNICLRLIERIK